ncbi:DUF3164 family protein [Plastoroseomonas hellenica]|uniref:DUF3164 family protein n=1 Tax=Plastoroseomonas hellenica TaxID=2687306 RepID=UPI001BAAE0B1|nr:DUF3164 family protein [Plastoroseomonas hellenica]MBR0644013.1 DUF3164 family protein [Plastoroseomonas hellenica]
MTTTPEGYLEDAAGRLVPRAQVKAEHLLEDEMVRELHAKAVELQKQLAEFREAAFGRCRALLELLAQQYQAPRGGKKGNVTFASYDGAIRVQIAVGDYITFGPELQVAKSLVDDCLRRWSEGANDNLRAIVTDAFQVDKEGKVQADRILALRRLDIEDPTWQRAMQAIGDAVRVTHSKEYVRFYARPSRERDHALVALDIAKA